MIYKGPVAELQLNRLSVKQFYKTIFFDDAERIYRNI